MHYHLIAACLPLAHLRSSLSSHAWQTHATQIYLSCGSPNQGQCCQRIYVQCYRHRNIPDVSPQQSERDSADDATISVNATSTYALGFPVNSPHDHCILRTGAPNGQKGRTAIPGSKWTIASFVDHVVTHELDDRSFGSKPPRTDSAVV